MLSLFHSLNMFLLQIKWRNSLNVFFFFVLFYLTFYLEEITDIIKLLANKCPNWLTIINQPKGIIISFNKVMDLSEIF